MFGTTVAPLALTFLTNTTNTTEHDMTSEREPKATEQAPKTKPDFRLIALDETQYWNLPEFAGKFTRIERVYLYDRAQHVYCCEMTPSYYLMPIETHAVYADNVSENVRDEINIALISNEDCEGMYLHVAQLDRLAEELSKEPNRTYTIKAEDFIEEEQTYEELLAAIEEDCRCNSRI